MDILEDKMKNLLLTIIISLINYTVLIAQHETYALRYTTEDIVGTARFVSLGGAFGALGAQII